MMILNLFFGILEELRKILLWTFIIVTIASNLIFFLAWIYREGIIKKIEKINYFSIKNIGKKCFFCFNILYGIIVIIFSYRFGEDSSFILNSDFLTAGIGILTFIITLTIYFWSEVDSLKRYLFFIILNIEEYIYISLIILTLALFKVNYIFLIGAFSYVLFLFYKIFKSKSKIESISYDEQEFIDILDILESKNDRRIMKRLYDEVERRLYESIKEEKIKEIKKDIFLWKSVIKENIEKECLDTDDVIRFLYKIYSVIKNKKNIDVFKESYSLNYSVAKIAYENKDIQLFKESLNCLEMVYDYYWEDGKKEELEFLVIGTMKYTFFPEILKTYTNDLKKYIEWAGVFYLSINNSLEKAIKREDNKFIKYFHELIDITLKGSKNIKKEQYLLKFSNYFGICLLLKSQDKESIEEEIQLLLDSLNSKNIGIEELYIFIQKYNIFEVLKWKKYFQPPPNIVRGNCWVDKTQDKIDELFLELLYLQYNNDLPYTKDNIIERMTNAERENIISMYSLSEKKKKDILIELFDEINVNIETVNKKEIREKKLSLKKINEIIEVIKNYLKNVKINKVFFSNIVVEEQSQKKITRGYCLYLDKEMFVETYKEFISDDIFEDYTDTINNALESIIVKKISRKSKNNKIKNLENIDRKKNIIIASGESGDEFIRKCKEIKSKYLLNDDEIKEHGRDVRGLYKEIPIYFFSGEIEGVFILEKKSIQEIRFFYKENNSIFEEEEIKKYITLENIGVQLEIQSFEMFYEKKSEEDKEKILKLPFLKNFKTKDKKINELKGQVLFKLYQDFEIIFSEEREIYQFIWKTCDES